MNDEELQELWESQFEDDINNAFYEAGYLDDDYGTHAHADFVHNLFLDAKDDFKSAIGDYEAQVRADYKKAQTGEY